MGQSFTNHTVNTGVHYLCSVCVCCLNLEDICDCLCLLSLPVGQHGIICLEDLIHEIYSTGKNFKVVNQFLWPFCLSVPRHSARDRAGLLKEMGEPGPRADDINRVIRTFN